MNKKLFVGRLPFEFSDAQLGALFAPAGTVVTAVMVPDPKNGRTRGFGFVDMSSEAEAQTAIQSLNGTTLGDKKIWVTLAREKGLAPAPRPALPRPSFNKGKPRSFEGGPPRRAPGHFAEQRTPFAPKKRFSGGRGPADAPSPARGPKRPYSAGPSTDRRPPSRFPKKNFRSKPTLKPKR